MILTCVSFSLFTNSAMEKGLKNVYDKTNLNLHFSWMHDFFWQADNYSVSLKAGRNTDERPASPVGMQQKRHPLHGAQYCVSKNVKSLLRQNTMASLADHMLLRYKQMCLSSLEATAQSRLKFHSSLSYKLINTWILPSSGLLRAVRWLETDVSVLPTGPVFKG